MSAFPLIVSLTSTCGWIENRSIAQADLPPEEVNMKIFYLYVYGNALSLLTGLFLGQAALVIARALRMLFPFLS